MDTPVWTKLRRFFEREEVETRAPAGPSDLHGGRNPAGVTAPTPANSEGFEAGLAQVIAEKTFAVSGKVHVVNIQAIRERLGARWAEASDRIHRIIESTLQARLSRKDLYTRHQDLNYVIIFGELSEAQAALKCSLLAEEIMAKVLGSKDAAAALDVRAAAVRVDGQVEFTGVRRADAIARLLQEAEQPPSPSAASAGPDTPAASRIRAQIEMLTTVLQGVEQDLQALHDTRRGDPTAARPDRLEALILLLREAEAGLARLAPTVHGADGGSEGVALDLQIPWRGGLAAITEVVQVLLREAEQGLTEVQAGGAASPLPADFPAEEAPSAVGFVYHPMWKPAQEMFGIYLCEAAVDYEGKRLVGEAALPPEADPAVLGLVDRLVLRRALLDARSVIEGGTVSVLCVPVHYRTLANANTCRKYLAVCRAIAPECRALMIWEVVQIPPGVWENPLFAALSQLRPFARSIFMRVEPDYQNFSIPAALGVQSLGVDLRGQATAEVETARALQRFAQQAHRCGLQVHAHGVGTRRLAMAAVRAGFDSISGNAISGPTDSPRGLLRFDLEGLRQAV